MVLFFEPKVLVSNALQVEDEIEGVYRPLLSRRDVPVPSFELEVEDVIHSQNRMVWHLKWHSEWREVLYH